MMMSSAITDLPPVFGLQASCVPSNDFTQGATMSICVMPLSQLRQSPHFSLRAGIPQLVYFATAQSWACCILGVPTNLGPMPFINSSASISSWEFSVASLIIDAAIKESLPCAKQTVDG